MDAKKEINLLNLNVNEHTEKKNNLTYLSWAWAAAEMLKAYPDMTYTVERDAEGNMYHGNPAIGYMVNTTVTAGGITREMWLPVMDYKNKALLKPTMTDINKAIMRCLTKNFAMFGLGLYIYAGEDLPEDEKREEPEKSAESAIQDKVEMPIEVEEDVQNEKCGDVELAVLENLCEKLNWKVEQVFKKWPAVTKGEYTKAVEVLRGRLGDADKRSA